MEREALERQVEKELAFLEDPDAAALIASRVAAQYAPAALAAPNEAAQSRAWEALRFYLTTRPTMRKPFCLGGAEAQRVIEEVKAIVLTRG